MDAKIKDFLSFLDGSGSRFHASRQITSRLEAAGFTELKEDEPLHLKKGGRYYLRRQDTATIAFVMGSQAVEKTGFNLAASHLDYPSLKLKPASVKTQSGVTSCGVEVYGGPILSTWIDRPLSIAGKVIINDGKAIRSELMDLDSAVAIIPNAAIHLNRDINKGFEYNKQTHLRAILSLGEQDKNPLLHAISKKLKEKPEAIGEMELFLYDAQVAELTGLNREMICAQGLDNLAMTHAILSAILECRKPKQTSVAVFFDHEEIGSETPQGAMSSLLGEILERICLAVGANREGYYLALRKSFLISADMAHAFHPSYAEKYDPDYAPGMNQGPVIKLNASHRYASTAESTLRFTRLCEAVNVPCQKFLVRSDMPCGSTVGPIVAAQLGLEAVDVGNPIWAMHSLKETGGVKDHLYLINALTEYYK